MGLTFTKKAASSATETKAPDTAQSAASPPKAAGVFFLKRGAVAKQAVQQEQAKAEARQAEKNRMRRFRLKYNGDGKITFLDGKLDEDGVLDIPRFFEHTVQIGQTWQNYVCTAEIDTSQPCPLCESGNKPSLVGVLTVLNHTPYTVNQGPNAGKVYVNRRELFVAKEGTLDALNKLAKKPGRNGLALCTFDVSRGPENKHPAKVGDTFDFVQKNASLEAIAAELTLKIEEVQPGKYEGEDGEIPYLPPEKLIELGLGKAHSGVGYEAGVKAASDEL